MARCIWALVSGAVFGAGLAISEMINPAKVLAFLDFAGRWDPSLAFVMAGALAVTFSGFRLILRRPAPLLGGGFEVPSRREIDRPLLTGAALFGIGWGLVGLCPGPAVASLVFGQLKSFVFIAAMMLGMWLYHATGRAIAGPPFIFRARVGE
jgi:uncharacterized membrane protein YedE/YeeE